jgi:glycosyltransferase involved in cell wall biosynthesis
VVAGYAGRLLPHKGIHVLMEAARRAMGRHPSLHLAILGDNPAHTGRDVRGELAQQAASWGLADRIHLAGWVPSVERALVSLDFVVIPSTCRECCSRSLIESLCLGLPVVASHVGGNPELLRHCEDGLLVPPGDPERLAEAFVALASEAPLRRRLAIGAFAARRRFDSVSVARSVAVVLRKAARDGARVGKGTALETIPAGP